MKADGILFDLDGTLWDASVNITRSWNRSLADLGYRPLSLETLQGCLGMPMTAIFEKLFPDADDAERLRIQEHLIEEENIYVEKHGGVLYDKMEETLETLTEKYTLTIVSNCQAGYIEAFMKAHRLEKYFADFESFGRTGLLKADNIRLVVERNHFEHPVYVGDIQADCDAAHAAGVPMIHAAYGFGDVRNPEGVILSFRELPKLLEPVK